MKTTAFRITHLWGFKKILRGGIWASLFIFPTISKAIGTTLELKPKYYNEWRMGYGTTYHTDGSNNYVGRALLGTIHGIKFNDYAQIGLGVDGVMFTHYHKGENLSWALNAYADMRGFYPINNKLKIFLDLGLGATTSLNAKQNTSAFFCQFGPGLQYKKFTLTTGLQHIGEKANTFYATVGFTF